MLTILCSPKPFVDEAAWNQLNALRSWRAIHPDIEIVIFGAPLGAAEAAAEVNAELVPKFETSSSGAPSFNAMVAYAEWHSRHNLIVYANCDILLTTSMLHAMQAARQRFDHFLLVGERLDLAQGVTVDVREDGWLNKLSGLAAGGKLTAHGPTGADYFGFTRGMWASLPPVFMGRAMCDQALLHNCLLRRIPVIDGTLAVVNLHQYHGYQHVPGGKQQVFAGEDPAMMAKAHGLRRSLPTVADADWRLEQHGVILPDQKRRHVLRRLELQLRYAYHNKVAAAALRALQYVFARDTILAKGWQGQMIVQGWQQPIRQGGVTRDV